MTVYTKDNCVQCNATKRLLNKLDIPYTEVNVDNDSDAREFIKGLGFLQAPVVVTDSDAWGGYNPDKIREQC